MLLTGFDGYSRIEFKKTGEIADYMTKTEKRILETLWQENIPMCAAEIAAKNPDLKEITIRTALKNMLKNDLVKLAGITQRTKTFARTFSANVAPEQVYREEINKISGLDHFRTACALLGEDKLSEEELGILRSIIDERLKK